MRYLMLTGWILTAGLLVGVLFGDRVQAFLGNGAPASTQAVSFQGSSFDEHDTVEFDLTGDLPYLDAEAPAHGSPIEGATDDADPDTVRFDIDAGGTLRHEGSTVVRGEEVKLFETDGAKPLIRTFERAFEKRPGARLVVQLDPRTRWLHARDVVYLGLCHPLVDGFEVRIGSETLLGVKPGQGSGASRSRLGDDPRIMLFQQHIGTTTYVVATERRSERVESRAAGDVSRELEAAIAAVFGPGAKDVTVMLPAPKGVEVEVRHLLVVFAALRAQIDDSPSLEVRASEGVIRHMDRRAELIGN